MLAFALKDQEVAEYHYRFYHLLATLMGEHWTEPMETAYSRLLHEELNADVHGEVDEPSWRMKQGLRRTKGTLARRQGVSRLRAAVLHRHADAVSARHLLRYRRRHGAAAIAQPLFAPPAAGAGRAFPASRGIRGFSGTARALMCGIAGFTHVASAPPRDRIEEITQALKHRGPDQQGTWESADVSLGAVRLKIIDLEGGAQPMIAGGTVIVFNGEIYNHLEVRRELESLGHRFESRCDTETVLRAFLEWDVESFERLRGMFAAAFWTESSRRLVLARDRMGIKPLYYHERNRDLYFGSELKAILLHPEIDRTLDPLGLDRYLSLNYVPVRSRWWKAFAKLPPGNYLEWRDGQIAIEPYWKLEFRPDERMDFGEAKQELDRLLRSAVREHLISDVPLGVWSSGGLDSTTILHYAAEASPAKLKTFSVSFRGRSSTRASTFAKWRRGMAPTITNST